MLLVTLFVLVEIDDPFFYPFLRKNKKEIQYSLFFSVVYLPSMSKTVCAEGLLSCPCPLWMVPAANRMKKKTTPEGTRLLYKKKEREASNKQSYLFD